jgi:hypothetical protein
MLIAKYLFVLIVFLALLCCSERREASSKSKLELNLNKVAEGYVRLVLQVGLYDADYVDAYYGPEEWKPKESSKDIDSSLLADLQTNADQLLDELDKLSKYEATDLEKKRYVFLYKHLLSVKGKLYMLTGGKFSFEQEAKTLFDTEVPDFPDEYFIEILKELNNILPGKGNLPERMNELRKKFLIPVDKLDTVFTVAITECRKRTLAHLELPENESFIVEYVKGQPWGAYNWYKGNNFSVIQVNIERPIYIESAIGIAAHEGYTGHHVFNSLLEKNLTVDNGWVEFSVYPLFSPLSFLAEGTAIYGIEMIFPGDSKIKFEKEILFPLAGLNSADADLYYKVLELTDKLDYADIHAAKNYLDGNWNREQTINYLVSYTLSTRERIEKKIQFIERYRAYIVNYNIGRDNVETYIIKNGGTEDDLKRRWGLFKELLSTPQTPSGLLNTQ